MASIELNRENQNYIFMEWTSGLYGNNRNMLKNKMFYNVDTINQFKCIKYRAPMKYISCMVIPIKKLISVSDNQEVINYYLLNFVYIVSKDLNSDIEPVLKGLKKEYVTANPHYIHIT